MKEPDKGGTALCRNRLGIGKLLTGIAVLLALGLVAYPCVHGRLREAEFALLTHGSRQHRCGGGAWGRVAYVWSVIELPPELVTYGPPLTSNTVYCLSIRIRPT